MRTQYLLRMACTAILAFLPGAAKAGTISLAPSQTTVTVGDVFQVHVIASDLQLGGYDLILSYNPLLAAIFETDLTFDSRLGGPTDSFTFLFPGLDTLEFGEVSLLTSESDLAALQNQPSFPLAHISVKALTPGLLMLDFVSTSYTGATNYSGAPVGDITYQAAAVSVVDPPPQDFPPVHIPEPTTAPLMAIAVVLLPAIRVWRHRRSQKP